MNEREKKEERDAILTQYYFKWLGIQNPHLQFITTKKEYHLLHLN